MKFFYAIVFSLIAAAGALAQADPAAGPSVEQLYLARDDGKGKAGEQVLEFNTSDIPIYCVVMLDATGKVTVKMNFVAVSVAGVKPETKVVTTSYTTKDGQNRVNFTGRPEEKWTPGKYRVDIFLDGKMAKNVEFNIKNQGANATASKFVDSPSPPKPPDGKQPRKP